MDEERAVTDRSESRMLESGALRALAHPLRIRIYDILSQYGPQTATSLATRLDESTGATSYHLRALAKHHLVREIEGRGSGRERWWERPRGAVSLTNPDVVRSPAGLAATQLVVAEFYRQRHEQLMAYMQRALGQDPEGWDSLMSTGTAHLTKEQFEELSESIQLLIDTAVEKYRDQRGDGVRAFSIRADIFPLDDAGAPG